MGVHPAWDGSVHEAIAGQVDPRWPPIDAQLVVNPRDLLPTGWGEENASQWQSGHTNNVVTNESAEQGQGVGPERKWAHWPYVDQPNPYRHKNALLRNGMDSYHTDVYRPEVVAYWAQALAHELSQEPVKFRQGPPAVVNQAPSVPFVSTVPDFVAADMSSPGGYWG